MTISYNRVQHYISTKISVTEMEYILNSIGLEIEEKREYSSITSNLDHCVVGEVVECIKHPNADRLKLTKVNIGGDETLQIICGAPNVCENQKIIVAKIGSTLTNIHGDSLNIKKANIRGVESYGMICAEDELGISDDHDGIMVLDDSAEIGIDAEKYLNPYKDTVFKIGLTLNRVDAMSHYGVARNIVSYLKFHKDESITLLHPLSQDIEQDIRVKEKNTIQIVVEKESGCDAFYGCYIKNITNGESPKFIQDCLKSLGVKTINTIVDITNFLMFEYGKPLHAYDTKAIKGNKVIVQKSKNSKKFIGLDGRAFDTTEDDILITDSNNEVLCLGGVFGGKESGVSLNTKDILIENAMFDSIDVRKTSMRHHLQTESASRFEKGVDPATLTHIFPKAIELILNYCGGEVVGGITQTPSFEIKEKSVTLTYDYINKIIGQTIHFKTIKKLLISCDYTIQSSDEDSVTVSIPSYKIGVSKAVDIVGDILRIIGYDYISLNDNISVPITTHSHSDQKNIVNEELSTILVHMGFNEILTEPFIHQNLAFADDKDKSIPILNATSSSNLIMRTSWLPNALKSVLYNINRKNKNLQLFEIAKKYYTDKHKHIEEESLYFLTTGERIHSHNRTQNKPFDIYYMKSIAEMMLEKYHITSFNEMKEGVHMIYRSTNTQHKELELINIVQLPDSILKQYDIKQDVFIGKVLLANLYSVIHKQMIYQPISDYPDVERDLSFILKNDICFSEIKRVILALRLNDLSDFSLTDIFSSEALIKQKKKSYSIRFIFRSKQKTLTHKEVDSFMKKIMLSLQEEISAEIRDKKLF